MADNTSIGIHHEKNKDITKYIDQVVLHYLTQMLPSNVILEEGFLMMVKGNFTQEKLIELLDTTVEIENIDISECSVLDFERGFSDAPVLAMDVAGENKTEAEPQPGDYVIQKEAGKAKQITKTKKKKENKQVQIDSDFIRLDSLLKLCNAVMTGGHAKIVIQESEVKVNNEICTARGKKIRQGDKVEFDGIIYEVI